MAEIRWQRAPARRPPSGGGDRRRVRLGDWRWHPEAEAANVIGERRDRGRDAEGRRSTGGLSQRRFQSPGLKWPASRQLAVGVGQPEDSPAKDGGPLLHRVHGRHSSNCRRLAPRSCTRCRGHRRRKKRAARPCAAGIAYPCAIPWERRLVSFVRGHNPYNYAVGGFFSDCRVTHACATPRNPAVGQRSMATTHRMPGAKPKRWQA